jgi:hypothetical protein
MRRAPYVVAALSVAMVVAGLLIPTTAYSEREIAVLFGLWGFSYAVVGSLVAASRPGNAIGWIMLGVGVLMSGGILLGQYAGYALLGDESLPLGREAAWATTWLYDPALCGIILLFLLFPQGRADGAVRAWTARACIAAGLLVTLAQAVEPEAMDGFGNLMNPYALESLAGPVKVVGNGAAVVLAATFVVALVSIVLRAGRSRGHERQQLQWITYAMVVLALALSVNILPLGLDNSWVGLFAVVLGLLGLPVSMAVAILRHRLYDIDVVINRTLVYGALTAVLVATYLLLVLGLRALLAPVTGESDLAVAASTLAVAALFRPLRNRIQTLVDQRFYRRRYDATLTLEAFAGRMRRQLDLEAVGADLRDTVHGTVQPLSVSLWLRDAEGDR